MQQNTEPYKTYPMPDGKELQIFYDEVAESPRDAWDCHAGKMLCKHGRYTLGDKHEVYTDDCDSWDEVYDRIMEECKPLAILSIYMYDHGGITISTGRAGVYSDRWDSGQIGFIYTTKEILDKLGVEDQYRTEEQLEEWLEEEVKQYDDFLRGEVYGYKVVEFKTCDLSCRHEIEVDSCWGYYGDDFKANGLFEAAGYETSLPVM